MNNQLHVMDSDNNAEVYFSKILALSNPTTSQGANTMVTFSKKKKINIPSKVNNS